jgi:hypothetical protein
MKPFLGPEEPATSHALRRVLVIDADPAARRMIGQALAAVATCTEAGDMDRAFAVLDRGDPDLIVLCLDDGASTEPDTKGDRLHHGRERHRQGGVRRGHPPVQPASGISPSSRSTAPPFPMI